MKFPAFEPIDLKRDTKPQEAVELSLSEIIPNEDQPRKNFDKKLLDELSNSIKLHGVIQPIIVRNIDANGKYQIIAGERRWRAAKQASLEKIPVIIKEYDKSNRMAVALIENIQRENLNPLEEAHAIQCLLEECAMTHNQIADSIGRSRTTVSNLLRLLNLENEVKLMINSGLLEMGHARALLGLSGSQQIETAEKIVNKNLSVRETEKLVQIVNTPLQAKQEAFIEPEFERKASEWKKSLSKKLSSKVNVHLSPEGKGKLVIHFESIEEADWLMNHLVVSQT